MIFISHKLHEVKAVADRVTVLRGGRAVATVDGGGRDAARARRADGRPGGRARPARRARTPPAANRRSPSRALRARRPRRGGGRRRHAGCPGRRDRRHRGRGRNGQRELAEAITGHASADRRHRACRGPQAADGDPRAAIGAGIAHVPEDRLGTGVASSLSIAENSVLKSYRGPRFSFGPLLRLRQRSATSRDDLIRRYDVQTPGRKLPARDLSGGNLQKLVLGREFSEPPEGARSPLRRRAGSTSARSRPFTRTCARPPEREWRCC